MSTSREQHDPYGWPEFYDILHTPGTLAEALALLRVARRFVRRNDGQMKRGQREKRGGAWLECGCGTGRYGLALLKRGLSQYVGVDLHPAMTAFARGRLRQEGLVRRGRIVLGDMRTLRGVREVMPRGGFHAAFCLDNSIRHLPSDRAMVEHLRSVGRVLRPGGVYIVGIGLRPEGGDSPSEHIAFARKRGVTVHSTANFLPPGADVHGRAARVEKCFVYTTATTRGGVLEWSSRYELRTWTVEQWSDAVRAGGMEEVAVVDGHARDLDAGRTAYAFRVLCAMERSR